MQQTILTFNGRTSVEEKPKENIYSGLESNNRQFNNRDLSSLNCYESDDQDRCKYYSFNRYNPTTTQKPLNNWAYDNSDVGVGSHNHKFALAADNNRYKRRSTLNKKYYNKHKSRPKPLQYENEKYYDHVFPKRNSTSNNADDEPIGNDLFYQPNSLEHAEL